MSLSWISVNARLLNGITLINSLSNTKFVLLLQQVTHSKDENIFTPEKLEKLEESLGLGSNKLQLLIQSIMHIFSQSSKIIIKPTVLQKQLVDTLKFDSAKAEEFVKAWTNTTKENFENLENRLKLEKLSWELNVQTSSTENAKQAIPNVRLKLGLAGANGPEEEDVVFELNEEELTQMYNTLEAIQNKLDHIQNVGK